MHPYFLHAGNIFKYNVLLKVSVKIIKMFHLFLRSKEWWSTNFMQADILCNLTLSELDIGSQFLNSIVCVPCIAIQEKKKLPINNKLNLGCLYQTINSSLRFNVFFLENWIRVCVFNKWWGRRMLNGGFKYSCLLHYMEAICNYRW